MRHRTLVESREAGTDFANGTAGRTTKQSIAKVRDMAPRYQNNSSEPGGILDSRILKFVSKLMLGIAVIMVFLTLVQCTVKKPQSPQWTTQLTVPLINRTYPMDELIRRIDQPGISLDSANQVTFSVNQEIDTFWVDASNFSTPDILYSTSQQLTPLTINGPIVSPVVVDLSSIPGIGALVPGIIPPLTFQIVNNIPPMTTFSSASISNGIMYFVITNNLGIDMNTLDLVIRDRVNNVIIATPIFPFGLLNGWTDSVLVSLNGKTISNDFEVTLTAFTVGGTITSTAGLNVSTAVHFNGPLRIDSGTAEIPATSFNFSSGITLNETEAIYGATFSSGQLIIAIISNASIGGNLNITLPDIIQGNSPLNIVRSVAPFARDTIIIDLTNYELKPVDSILPQTLNINAQIDIPGSAPNQLTINQGAQLNVSAQLSGLAFSSVTAVLTSTTVNIPPTIQSINVPDGFDSVQLVSAVLSIDIENSLNVGGTISLNLDANTGKNLSLNGTVAAGFLSTAVITTLIDSTVANFLSPLPSSVTVSGTIQLGDGITAATITPNDYIVATVRISAPLEIIIGSSTIQADIERSTINQADISIITDHVSEARFVYNIINHLPLGAQVNIYFGPDSATLYSNPQLLISNLRFQAAPVIGGIVSDTSSLGYQTVQLTNADIRILENDTLFISSEIILDDSGGQPVRFMGSDYMTLIGRIEVDYLFDGTF